MATVSAVFAGMGVAVAMGVGEAVGLLKNRPSMFGRGVAEATGARAAGVIAGVIAGADAAAFLCERVFAAGDAAGVVALVAVGDSAAAGGVSDFFRPRCFAGVGDAAADSVVAASGAGVGEAFCLRPRCFAGEGEAAVVGSLGVGD